MQATAKSASRKTLKISVIVLVIALIMVLSYFFLRPTNGDSIISASDVQPISSAGIVSRVSVSGTIEPAKNTTIYTSLSSPISSIAVNVGDRVAADQILVELDPAALQRQLDEQEAANARAAAANVNSIQSLQETYRQTQEQLDLNLNPEINASKSAYRTATDAYQQLLTSFEEQKKDNQTGLTESVRTQEDALKSAREQAEQAALDRTRADFGLLNNSRTNLNNVLALSEDREKLASEKRQLNSAIAAGDIEASAQHQAAIDSLNASIDARIYGQPEQDQASLQAITALTEAERRADSAEATLANTERDYLNSLAKVDSVLAATQREVAAAQVTQQEAAIGMEAAQLSVQHQLAAQSLAIDGALGLAAVDNEAADRSTNQMRVDINSGTIRAPYAGIISAVQATQGQPAAGALLSVADDGQLIIKGEVSEADISNVKMGTQATFTTPATGAKEFSGRVTKISPVATATSAASQASSAQSGKVTFAVEIAVSGDKEGLLLGSTARTRIINEIAPQALTVPIEAVFQDDSGTDAILVLRDDHVQQVSVRTGESNDFDIAVSATELSASDQVLVQPDLYQQLRDQRVTVSTDTAVEQG